MRSVLTLGSRLSFALGFGFGLACVASASVAAAASAPSGGKQVNAYGTGTTGGSGTAPDLWASEVPRPGSGSFSLLVDDGLANAPALPLLAFSSAQLSAFGLSVLVDTNSAVSLPLTFLDGSGSGSIAVPIPNNTGILGTEVFAQSFVIDPGAASAIGLSSTNGLSFTISRSASLVVPRSIGGNNDPQVWIDLASGSQTSFGASNVNNGQDAEFTCDGTHVFVPAALSNHVAIFDTTGATPAHVNNTATTSGRPYHVTINPAGTRAYVVNQGGSGTNPEIEILDAIPGSPTFGLHAPDPAIDLGGRRDCHDVKFAPDGLTAYCLSLGIAGGPATYMQIDTDPTSLTYHQIVNTITFSEWGYAHAIAPDGTIAYVALFSLGALQTQIALVDLVNFQVIDVDPGAPGTQNIGGQVSVPATPMQRQVPGLAVDPRGGVLYLAEYTSVARLNVDTTSAGFGTILSSTAGFPSSGSGGATGIVVDAVGDKVYFALASGARVLEYDTETWTLSRTFNVGTNPTWLGLR